MSQYGYIMAHPPAHYTHPRLQIRTAQDAHRVFEAVRQGILPLIRRRLSPSERDLLASGQVFVWEEAPTGSAAGDEISQTTSGLERWTDGRRWSQSRMREPFLFYEEKVQTTPEERQAKADRRARKASSSDSQSLPGHLLPIRRQDRPSKPDGLTKQTYSSYVYLPAASSSPSSTSPSSPSSANITPRKWHCVAYFSASDWNNLPGVEVYPELKNIVVPEGVYVSTKGTGKTGPPTTGTGSNSPYEGNSPSPSGVGPIRRSVSRGEFAPSPYASSASLTPKGRGDSFEGDKGSPHLHGNASSYLSPHGMYHHHHSGSISSASTGSPPTPGFMAPIPTHASFNSTPPPSSRDYPRNYSSDPRKREEEDVMMIDAPARTPTADYPRYQGSQLEDGYFTGHTSSVNSRVFPTSRSSSTPHTTIQTHGFPSTRRSSGYSEDGSTSASSSFSPSSASSVSSAPPVSTPGGTVLPSLPSVMGQAWGTGPPGRSKEDSQALGAFKISL